MATEDAAEIAAVTSDDGAEASEVAWETAEPATFDATMLSCKAADLAALEAATREAETSDVAAAAEEATA